MPDRQSPETLFVEHLDWIKKVAGIACAKHRVWDGEAEEFASWIVMKLMEDDYAVIRDFRGESGLRTYLSIIVARQFHEYRRQQFGRWRRSAAAERLGPPAPDLEALVYRHGYTVEQAGEKLRTEGKTEHSNKELAQLLQQLPRRGPLRPVEVPSDAVLDRAPGTSRADERVAATEADEERGRVMDALERATSLLDPADQAIVRMRFKEGRTLAFVARALKLEQKPLYRRLERILKELREHMEREGVRGADALAILGEREDS
jgi:RNA polymerase sigma factor for flagellar operon FliA